MAHKSYLCVADVIIQVNSKMPPQFDEKIDWRYGNFVLNKKPTRVDLVFDLNVSGSYRKYVPKVLFETRRDKPTSKGKKAAVRKRLKALSRRVSGKNSKLEREKKRYMGDIDWRISRCGGRFLLEGGSSGSFQVLFDKDFKKINVTMVGKDKNWKLANVFTGFLQLFMIYYLAAKEQGIVVHSTAIKDKQAKGRGYLFAGLSGAGKSTTSRIWDKYAGGIVVLNDDRIIVRKKNGRFYLYGTPWHGDFSDYLKTSVEPARLTRSFCIYHSRKNHAEKVSQREFFSLFFQSVFPPFWDRDGMEFVSGFMKEMMEKVPCYKFGFKNNRKIIDYVRAQR